jgi:hypothetical protein
MDSQLIDFEHSGLAQIDYFLLELLDLTGERLRLLSLQPVMTLVLWFLAQAEGGNLLSLLVSEGSLRNQFFIQTQNLLLKVFLTLQGLCLLVH